MHLWTEYEGRTVDEHYTLGKLLRSEGRNGFFATADKDGHPAVIRLTEAHYDEAELLNRWRQVAEVHQDNLIEIEQVGQTSIEGVALTYALMEPDDANLGDVLKERPLTTAETLQVAKAVLAAVRALHSSGLVHEHIEPSNVLAVGETVKLRSDCVRECIADGEFSTEETCAELRRKDLHDFGTLLLRCLTLESEFSPAHNNLPDPFKRVIPRALDGTWTLEQIANAIDPTLASQPSAGRVVPTPAASPAPQTPGAVTPSPVVPVRQEAAAQPAPRGPLVPAGVRQMGVTEDAALNAAPAASAEPSFSTRSRFSPEPAEPTRNPSKATWIIAAIALVVVLFLTKHFLSGNKDVPVANSHPAPVVSGGNVRSSSSAAPVTPVSPEAPAPVMQAPAPVAATPAHAAGGSGWYVIAFTYNHEGQAAAKAQRLRRTHDSLHPQVFSPTGHGPYFVSLGGPMANQDEAEAVYRHARRAGLPRDTFVRHY